MKNFKDHFLHELQRRLESDEFRYTDNSLKYYQSGSPAAMQEDQRILSQYVPSPFPDVVAHLAEYIEAEVQLKQDFYTMLADSHSRDILVLLAVYNLLGHRFVKFPYHQPGNREKRQALHRAALQEAAEQDFAQKARNDEFGIGYGLHLYNAAPVGRNFQFYSSPEFLLGLAQSPQYVYERGGARIRAEQGDYVLDCGACAGDTAIMFADDVGPEGRVFSFEAHPVISIMLRHNIGLNEHLRERITLIPKAVCKTPDSKLSFALQGASSSFMADVARKESPVISVAATSIDREVETHALPRLDFIKMDIEGAELEALMGAEASLRKFRPKLAICLYHSPQDFFTIPAFLKELDLGYQFYLDHHHVNDWESVLYALPDPSYITARQ